MSGDQYDGAIALVRALVGKRVTSVRYIYQAGLNELPKQNSSTIHEIDHGIDLVTSDGDLVTLLWQMEGDCAALCAVEAAGRNEELTDLVAAYDASDLAPWGRILDRKIASIDVAWSPATPDCPRSPQSYQVSIDKKTSFVVTLAALRSGELVFSPDTVSVIFDRESLEATPRIDLGFRV